MAIIVKKNTGNLMHYAMATGTKPEEGSLSIQLKMVVENTTIVCVFCFHKSYVNVVDYCRVVANVIGVIFN